MTTPDLISTTRYENLSKTMAMKLGGESDSRKLRQNHFVKFAEEVGLAKPIVRARIAELASSTLNAVGVVSVELPEANTIALALSERTRMFLALVTH